MVDAIKQGESEQGLMEIGDLVVPPGWRMKEGVEEVEESTKGPSAAATIFLC